MFQINENNGNLSFVISSEMKLVDRIIKEVCTFVENHSQEELSGVRLVTRELLINAIEHGNKNIQTKHVECSIAEMAENRFRITVSDEGEGFNYANAITNLPESTESVRSRGLPLIYTIADSIEFNERGNSVTAYITVVSETYYEHKSEVDYDLIKPTGDITAATADKLRQLLYNLITSKHSSFKFDLQNVYDIDSVGLSTLIVLSRNLEKSGRKYDLTLMNVSDDIKKLFTMTHLDNIYHLV